MDNKSSKHWNNISKNWKYFGSPLRPHKEDVDYFQTYVFSKFISNQKFNVKIYGVTPEIVNMDWPANSKIVSVEQSLDMIKEFWPGDADNKRKAYMANWLDTLEEDGTFDVVIGDGCFISMSYPSGYKKLSEATVKSLSSEGLFIMRFFIQKDIKESSEEVVKSLLKGEINTFHTFKWRFAMSLQESSLEGVELNKIYNEWKKLGISPELLMEKFNWSKESINTINLYKDKHNSFTFATLDEILDILKENYVIDKVKYLNYEFAERCPIITGFKK
jgi:hypothetical protein